MFKMDAGDLWTYSLRGVGARCVLTAGNLRPDGSLAMQDGTAQEARKKFPGLAARWGAWTAEFGTRVWMDRKEPGWLLINFPAIGDWRFPAREWNPLSDQYQPTPWYGQFIDRLRASADQLVEVMDKFGLEQVLLPPPGVGLDGADWLCDVAPELLTRLDERVTVLLPFSLIERTQDLLNRDRNCPWPSKREKERVRKDEGAHGDRGAIPASDAPDPTGTAEEVGSR